jgi:ABC-type transporter Mla MlaB component
VVRYDCDADFTTKRGLALPELSPQRALTTVEVTGPVTLAEVARWRDAFADGLARGPGLRIDLEGTGPWDVAGVQLLLATIATAERTGRPISLSRVPNVLSAVAERAGLHDRLAAVTER